MKRYARITCGLALPLLLAGPAAANQWGEHGLRQAASPLVREVRRATQRFADVQVAIAEGYAPFLGCASGRDGGAMGVHYVAADLLGDGELDVERPEALLYEPVPGGRLRLVGVEYITFVDAWNAVNDAAPVLAGHVLHLTGEPNRYGIPAHYELHVWAWKSNPDGTFADWNRRVSCERYETD